MANSITETVKYCISDASLLDVIENPFAIYGQDIQAMAQELMTRRADDVDKLKAYKKELCAIHYMVKFHNYTDNPTVKAMQITIYEGIESLIPELKAITQDCLVGKHALQGDTAKDIRSGKDVGSSIL